MLSPLHTYTLPPAYERHWTMAYEELASGKVDQVIDRFSVPISGRSVLDAGSGAGHFSLAFLRRGAAHVTSLDVFPGLLHRFHQHLQTADAGIHLPRSALVLASLTSLPYDDRSFDVVWCSGVLPFVDDEQKALEELSRVLKKDGHLIVRCRSLAFSLDFIARRGDLRILATYLDTAIYWLSGRKLIRNTFQSVSRVTRCLISQGLSVEQVYVDKLLGLPAFFAVKAQRPE